MIMTQTQQPISLALAVPDTRMATAYLDAKGTPQLRIPNQMRLPQRTLAQVTEKEQMLWFPRPDAERLGASGPIVNTCADFHGFGEALRDMREKFAPGIAVFNHPDAIAHAASVELRDTLGLIDGLQVPLQCRVIPRRPEDFENAVRTAGLSYPLRVQRSSDRKNGSVIIVRDANGWEPVLKGNWPHMPYTLTEVRTDDLAQHLRIRLTVVGSRAEHISFAYTYPPGQLIPNFSGYKKIAPQPLQRIFTEVARRVLLDHWTAEFSIRATNQLGLEYLWAALPVPDDPTTPDPSVALWKRIAGPLDDLIADPMQWRYARAQRVSGLH